MIMCKLEVPSFSCGEDGFRVHVALVDFFFCISTVRMVVLVNDTTDFFLTHRGLRQGDPSSPYLFVLIMVVFNGLIAKA